LFFLLLLSWNVSEVDLEFAEIAELGSNATGMKKLSPSPLIISPDITDELRLFL
jgi:hypothetical protein